MESKTRSTIKFQNPPIHEIVCGILFHPIKGLQTGHFGILWQKFRPDFPVIEEHNPLQPIPEEGMNRRNQLIPPRVWFVHKDVNEVVQVQFNRFTHNWRKRRPDDVYPGYETVLENFEKYLSRFEEFLDEENLEKLVPNQYEITYFDHVLENEGWETLNDLEKIFPNFISQKDQNSLPADIRDIHWQMVFGLPNDFGNLHLSIQNVRRISDDRDLLRIQLTAHSNEAYKPMRDWFDIAHKEIIEVFTNIISDKIQNQFWGREPC